jgi:hypothetical protein
MESNTFSQGPAIAVSSGIFVTALAIVTACHATIARIKLDAPRQVESGMVNQLDKRFSNT